MLLRRFHKAALSGSLLTAMLVFGGTGIASAQGDDTASPAADNTKANRAEGKTADQQKDNKGDLAITQQIRKAIVGDKSLSTYAHNVKVITRNGTVTLRGPVRSEEEKSAVEAKAKLVAGAGSVQNELTVASKKPKG